MNILRSVLSGSHEAYSASILKNEIKECNDRANQQAVCGRENFTGESRNAANHSASVLHAFGLAGQTSRTVCSSERAHLRARPRLRIQLPKPARYVGGERWLLFGIADCEIHVFVQADAQN